MHTHCGGAHLWGALRLGLCLKSVEPGTRAKRGPRTVLAQNLEITSHTSNLLNRMSYSPAFTKTPSPQLEGLRCEFKFPPGLFSKRQQARACRSPAPGLQPGLPTPGSVQHQKASGRVTGARFTPQKTGLSKQPADPGSRLRELRAGNSTHLEHNLDGDLNRLWAGTLPRPWGPLTPLSGAL